MKACPYCAEKVQDAAVFCRYCRKDLPAVASSPVPDVHKKDRTWLNMGWEPALGSISILVGFLVLRMLWRDWDERGLVGILYFAYGLGLISTSQKSIQYVGRFLVLWGSLLLVLGIINLLEHGDPGANVTELAKPFVVGAASVAWGLLLVRGHATSGRGGWALLAIPQAGLSVAGLLLFAVMYAFVRRVRRVTSTPPAVAPVRG